MQAISPLRVKVDAREKQILKVLLDKQCLAILCIAKKNPMNASMICSGCNISISTTYRKLKLLQKLNLLRITFNIQPNGKKSLLFQSKITRFNILLHDNQLPIHTNLVSPE